VLDELGIDRTELAGARGRGRQISRFAPNLDRVSVARVRPQVRGRG
jgi:hypothetical protein